MQTWLLISHCQTFGLANSFNLLAPGIQVEAMDIWQYRTDIATVHAKLAGYDRVIALPEVLETPGADFSSARQLDLLPGIDFQGYHPDLCYATGGTEMVEGPTHAYHSMIAIAAYNRGLSVEDTLRLYNAASYEACGYFDMWRSERDVLLARFDAIGIDLTVDLRRWSAGPAFMYSVNHPRIACLHDLARAVLERAGVEVLHSDILPPDNLVNSVCFAVYPEIGERVGVEGSYVFKIANSHRCISLETFVRGNFEAYARFGVGNIVPDHKAQQRFAALDALF